MTSREVSGQAELQVAHRGHHAEIDIFPGEPLNNKLASNVVDLCPVGALCSKDFLYKHRVWNLKTKESVCADCSTGCSIYLDGNKNIVYRLRLRNHSTQTCFVDAIPFLDTSSWPMASEYSCMHSRVLEPPGRRFAGGASMQLAEQGSPGVPLFGPSSHCSPHSRKPLPHRSR